MLTCFRILGFRAAPLQGPHIRNPVVPFKKGALNPKPKPETPKGALIGLALRTTEAPNRKLRRQCSPRSGPTTPSSSLTSGLGFRV